MKLRISFTILLTVLAYAFQSAAQPSGFAYSTPPDSTSTDTVSVGTPAINFDISPLGAATFSITMECPQGLPGLTPNVGIAYNSQNGNGVAGYGCNITGISSITRLPHDFYHDNQAGGIGYSVDDAFSLDGKRLVMTQAAAGSDTVVYCLEDNPCVRIVLHGVNGSSMSALWFSVDGGNGMRYEYGRTISEQMCANDFGVYKNIVWYLNKTISPEGNEIRYYFTRDRNCLYPYRILYGYASNQRIQFEYESRPDTVKSAFLGFPVDMGKRLKSVTSAKQENGTWHTFRNYALNYDETGDGTSHKFSRLTSVTESNGTGGALRPVTISWNYLPYHSVATSNYNLTNSNGAASAERKNVAYIAIDSNGDGLSDVIKCSRVEASGSQPGMMYLTAYQASFNASGNIQFTKNELGSIVDQVSIGGGWNCVNYYPSAMDADGDGQSELLIPQYFQSFDELRRIDFQLFRLSQGGQGYAGISYNLQLDDYDDSYLYTVADLDNDGRDEIVVIEEHSDGTAYPGAVLWSHTASSPQKRPLRFVLQGKPKQILSGDFNGDGMTDIMVFYNSGYGVYLNDGTWVQATTIPLTLTTNTYLSGYSVEKAYLGDFNGDRTVDILFCTNSGADWYLRMGDGKPRYYLNAGIHFSLEGSAGSMNDHLSCMVYDMDGDGRSDAVITKKVGSTAHTYWMKSNGTTLVQMKHTTSTLADDALSLQKTVGDFNGDGIPELADYSRNCYVSTSSGTPKFYIYRNSQLSSSSGRVSRVTDGLGNYTAITYKPLTDMGTYTKGTGAAYPVADIIPPLPVVRQTVQNDGAAGTKTFMYYYGGLKSHVAGRGLMGFTSTTASCSAIGVSNATDVEWDTTTYTPASTTHTKTIGDETTSDMSHVRTEQYGTRKAYYHLPDRNEHTDAYGYRTITTRGFLPEYKNAVEYEITGYPEGHTVISEYDDYILRRGQYLPQTIERSQNYYQSDLGIPNYEQEWFYDTTTLQYDTYGRITSKTEHAGTSIPVTTVYTYDSNGNILTENESASGVETVTRQYQYDYTGLFLTKTIERGYIVKEYTHDRWGNVITETDKTRSAYPQTTTHAYDDWGNLASTTSPDGVLTTNRHGWGAAQSKKYYVLEQGTARPWVKTWFDSKGREVQTESIGQGDLSLKKVTTYNINGQVSNITNWQGTQSVTEAITYYSNGRKRTDVLSTGESTAYTYGWQSITATKDGRATSTHYDSWGNVLETEDALGNITTYRYSSCGKPASVTSCGSTVTMEYDEIGNQTLLADPDAGIMAYTYDAYGRIKTQTDGRNIITTNNYDAKGRLSSTITGGVTTTYTYGQTSSDMGLLLSTSRSSNTIAYEYDQFGRVSQETRTVSGLGTRSFQYTYGANGLLETMQYPGQVSVGYQYDCYGNRSTVTANGNTVWQMDDITAQNSHVTTTVRLGSSLKSTLVTDMAGRTTAKSIGYYGSGSSFFSMTFTYNATTGNMTGRTGMMPEAETFTYDNLDRLTGIACGGTTTQVTSYSNSGNITSKTGIGSYFYDDPRPHAVSAVENTGLAIPLHQLDTEFNCFGKVSQIVDYSSSKYRMTFDYGPDNERWCTKLYKNNSTLKRTTYYLGGYEEIVENGMTRQLYYLDGNVLYKKQTSCPDSVFYIFTDHLGSIIAIVDQSGSEKFRTTYDAWGNQTVIHNDLGFHRGYTGHEMLPEFGLINMNGRLYDPQIGRFLSTDNFVQQPWNSQNFNRYSYCLNNPLKYTDPSGEFIHIIIGAAIGGVANLAFKAMSGQVKSWGDGFAAFGIGAAAGAIGAATGGAAFALAGGAAGGAGGFIAGVASGAVAAATSMPVQSVGNHLYFGDPMMTGKEYLIGIGTSALIGGVMNGAIAEMNGRNFINGDMKPVRLNLTQLEAVPISQNEYPLSVRTEKDAIAWPDPDYVEGTRTEFTISEGNHIDRYAFSDESAMNGRYFSTPDVPFEMRSLPYTRECYNHYEFEVLKPLPGMKSLARPFFNQPGNGFQFVAHPLPGTSTIPTAQQLKDAGFIKIIINF